MLFRLPPALRAVACSCALALSTPLLTLLMMPAALLKLLVPATPVRRVCDRWAIGLATAWVAVNNAWIAALRPSGTPDWDVQGLEGLDPKGWYLVSPNHQSWVDILVLQRIFHPRIPFLKFFLKQELIWVPVIGLAWWALDFPFMKRHSLAALRKNPELRQQDRETTRKACAKFALVPTSVMNFAEGTRFTRAKHHAQKSPYRHLLKPKIGGLGIALATMGEQFESMLDVTIVYPHGTPTFWELLSGRLDAVLVRVQPRDIPAEVLGGDPVGDKAYRQRLTAWIEGLWAEKDALIERLLGGG